MSAEPVAGALTAAAERVTFDCLLWISRSPHLRSARVGRWRGIIGGVALHVTCMPGARGGFVLLVPSESERGVLLEMLAQNAAGSVDVRAEQMELRAPWLAVGVGVGALALFGWVLSTIRVFFP